MYPAQLKSLLAEYGVNPECLQEVIQQGVDVERINLQTLRILGSVHESYECECRILQGEIFLSMLRRSMLRA